MHVKNFINNIVRCNNNVVSCCGNSNVQINSSGKSITVQNDCRIETDSETINISFKKPRKVYINGELIKNER